MAKNQKISWSKHVNKMLFAYNCTKHEAIEFSPFELLFGRKPKLPLDIIFGDAQTPVSKRYLDYVKQWKNAIEEAHRIATEKAGHCAARGRDRYNAKVRSSELKADDRVLVKNFAERAVPNKLRSFWEDKIYIKNRKGPDSPVYEIKAEKELRRSRNLHRNLLLPCSHLQYEAKNALPWKLLQIRQKVENTEPRMPESFVTPKHVEDQDFQTLLPSQLQGLDTYFANSSIDNNAAEGHIDLAQLQQKLELIRKIWLIACLIRLRLKQTRLQLKWTLLWIQI